MEIIFIIVSICLTVFVALFATIRIADLERDIRELHKQLIDTANKKKELATVINDGVINLKERMSDIEISTEQLLKAYEELTEELYEYEYHESNYKDEVMKAAASYIYMEMCYLRNNMNLSNVDYLCEDFKKRNDIK